MSNNTLALGSRKLIRSTAIANFVGQREAAAAIGVSGNWLSLRRDPEAHPLFAPALRLGDTPKYHREQIRLWIAAAAGNQTEQDAREEWAMIRASLGRRELRIEKRA